MARPTTPRIHTMEQCIDNCTNCHRICLETAARHFRGERAPRLDRAPCPAAPRLCRDLPDQRRFHDPGVGPAPAYLPGLCRHLQSLRGRVRPDGRRPLHGVLRGDLPPLRRNLRARWRALRRSRPHKRIEAEPAFRGQPDPAVGGLRPAQAGPCREGLRVEALDRQAVGGPEAQIQLLQRHGLVGQLLRSSDERLPSCARPLVGRPFPQVPLPACGRNRCGPKVPVR